VGPQELVEDKWHELSEFRGEKARDIDIKIHDIEKSKIPMR
jgi:hypothetical protein